MYNLQINELTPGQKYYVKVRAKAPGYATSEWSPAFEFEAEQDQIPPERVRNLTFTSEGDSFIARWEAPELNMDGTPCTDLSHYKITLVNFDASRTVHLETSNPEFTIDFNSNKQLFGTPSGIIEITVSAVDRVSNVGPGSSKIAQNMPPAKVNNVTAQSSVEAVTLKWDPSVETDIEKYNIYVSNEGPGFAMTQATLAGSVAFGTNTFAHTTMSLSPLYFKVTAVDKFLQQSPASNVAMAQPKLTTDFDKTPPGAVANFTAVQSLAPDNSTAIARLSFTAAADNDLDKYEVQYRKTGETTLPWSFLTIPSDQTSAEIKSLPLSTSYDFRIRAVDFLANKGDWSAVVVAPGVKKTTLPAAPTGVTVRGGMSNLMVTWNASTDPSMSNWAGTYEVQISKETNFSSPTTIKTSSTLASFINLDQDTVYYVRVRAIDPYENTGAWSTTVNGNTGTVADANASRVIWSDTQPATGKTNDLWIKTPENVQYRFDGTDWVKAQDTELAGAIDNVRQTADGKNKAWYQTTKPPATNNTQGDLWFDTDGGNKLHVWSTSANDWVSAQDAAIQDALDDAAGALQTADGKNTIFYTAPASGVTPREGDTWFDNAVIKVYKNGAWVNASDDLDTAKARQAIQIAGSKNKTYYVAKASATGMIEGDILFDTADGNKQYRYNGTAWVSVQDAAIEAAESAAGQAQETADKKNTIYYSTPPTTGVRDGDTWFDGPTIKTYRNGVWTDSSSNLETQQGADAIQIAGSKNKTYYTTFANRPTTGLTEGDLLFDTGDKYKQYRYTNAGWLSVQDGTIADAKTAADNAKAAADTANQAVGNLAGTVGDLTTQVDNKVEVWFQTNQPAVPSSAADRLKMKGDIWINTSTGASNGEVKMYPGTGTVWNVVTDPAAIAAAQTAKNIADSKRQIFGGQTVPINNTTNALQVNDLWIRDSDKKMHRWTGSAWEIAQDAAIAGLESKGTDLIINGTGILGNNYNFSAFVFDPSDAPAGARGSFTSSVMSSVREADSDIPYDTSKAYKLTYSLRKGNPDVGTGHYAGFIPKDAAGNTIPPGAYMYESGTTTTLAAPLNPGDTVIKLSNSTNWCGLPTKPMNNSTHRRSLIFWDYTDSSGKLWPVETYSRNYNLNMWDDGAIDPGTHTITLRVPWAGPAKAAGTPLSNGSSGSTYMYSSSGAITSEWTRYSNTIAGEYATPANSGKTSASFNTGVPPGTAFVKFFVIVNHNSWSQAGSITKIAGISLSDASAAYDHATTAIQSANARNRNIYSTGNATGNSLNGYSFADGDTWYRRDANDTIVGMWERKDNSWVAKTLNNQVIANLDAGKINAGTINADRIGSNSIDASKIVVGGMDGSVVIKDGTVTADELATNSVIAGKIATGAVTAEKIKAGEIDATKIVQGGMDGSVVIENGTITATEIAGQTITGDKIKGNTIDATHIKAGSITIGSGAPIAPGTVAIPSDVTAAENRAKADATSKANAAQAAAIQAAATDAQAKANAAKAAAEQAAKDYADGQITQAEAAAIAAAATDAQAKADAAKQAAIQAAATDATTKANNAKTAAETAAKGYTDGQVGPINTAVTGINTKLGGWSHPTNTTFIDGGKIYTDSITAGQIAANAITASELAANAVTAAKIKAGEIDSTKIVSTGLDGSTVITNGTITTNKIGAKQITGAKIAADTITVGNMGPNSVDRTVIKDGEIITSKLAADAVKAGNIDAGAIQAGHIAAGAITIGVGKPIAPGTVAVPTDVENAKSEAIAEAEARDAAIQIGGRNLLTGTSSEPIERTSGTSGYYFQFGTDTKLVAGQQYTFSFVVDKISEDDVPINVHVGVGHADTGYTRDISGWRINNIPFGERVSITHTPTEADLAEGREFFAYRFRYENRVTTIAWRELKLELGGKATDWTPAPEDVDASIAASEQRAKSDAIADADAKISPIKTLTDGWKFTGKTTINGGQIEADTIKAAQIAAGAITIGPNAPIAPGTVAIPSDVSTAKTEAINAAASDATTKANNAKTGAENTAKGYTDGQVGPINTTIGGWKYGNTTFINGGSIYTRTITADKIKASEITANEIRGETITANELAANSVVSGKIKTDEIEGKHLKTNTALIKALNIQSSLTINAAGGHIKSSNYNANGSAGFYMDQQQLIINDGKIKAAAIELQDSSNIMPPLYASFNANASAYEVAKFWRGSLSGTTKVANDGKFGGGSVQFVITSNTGFVGMGASATDLNIPIEGGNQYIISFYVSNRSSKAITLQPQLYQTSSITIKGTATSITNTTAWRRYSVLVTAPASMTRAILRFNLTAGATATFKLDGIQVEQKTGAVDTPSNWSPPGYTSIDGESITTGSISSSATARTNSAIAAWSIDTQGRARFGDVTVDGKIIVGEEVSNKEATSIQSDTYSAGIAGWAIKGNGDVEFNNGTFRGMLSLEKAGVDLTMNASVSTIDAYIDTTNFKPIDTANIRGTTYGYKRETAAGSNVYMPTEPDPSRFAHFFVGPTTEKALNLQVHDGPEQDNIYLSEPPSNITLTSINLGEQTNPNAEPSFRENQGVVVKTYRNEARDYNLGGQQTGSDLNATSSSYELLTRERSAVIPEIAVGESEYPQAKHEWASTSVYETPKKKNLFPDAFVRGAAFTHTKLSNTLIVSVTLMSGVGQFGLGALSHAIYNNTVSAAEVGFDVTVNVPTAGPHIVSFYVDASAQLTSPVYARVAENSASFIANEGVSPAINHSTFGVLGPNHTELSPGTKEKRISFYIGSLAAGTRTIRFRFWMNPLHGINIYKPQLERAAFRDDASLPAEIRQSYLPTPWTENNVRSSSNVSFRLQAEPIINPLEFERSIDAKADELSKKHAAEAVLSFNAESQSTGSYGYQSVDAEFKFSPMGMTFPGADVPYLPTGAAIDYDFTGMALNSRPAVGGSTSGVTLRVNNYPVRVNNGREVADAFPNDIATSKNIQMPGWDIRNQAAENVTLRVYAGSLRSSESNNRTSPSGDGLILARKTTKMSNTDQSVTVTMLKLQFPLAAWASRGGPVINIDPATGARIVAYFDIDDSVIRVIRYSNYTTQAATILTAPFAWSGNSEFTLTLSRSGNNISVAANGNVLGTATNQSNLPNGLYTGISPRSGSFRNFLASDGGDLPGAPGEIIHAINVNNGRGLSVDGADGLINVSAPGFYQVSMYLFPNGKFGTNSSDHFQIMVHSDGRNQRMSPDLSMYGDGIPMMQGSTIAYLTGVAEFLVWTNDGSVNRLNRAEIRIVRLA